ncbi:ImmA/IrrE family metallo-endopeptidase [Blautia sp. MSJ-9]|uniref:ImmA/IrrE family metallo-endopeptidase n=1 Tax=Blautia sp. MSJ-9 TaxID=2841511 RepID=UPI001C121E6B|nr:ImmA/IrrE family metallo-endopeptidase [Blautia sp. MSJ-9]
MESQTIGIAPRILMPRATFVEATSQYDIVYGEENWQAIYALAQLLDVSKQSVMIRLEECGLL